MKRTLCMTLLLAGLLAVTAAPASARARTALLGAGTETCAAPVLAPLLAGFGDARSYFLAPGGDFESAASGWTLTGGATVAPGSGPLRLGRARSALRLPPGATATTPTFCVDLNYPTFRFFAQRANAGGGLSVDVAYPALGDKKPKAASVNAGSGAWTLTSDVDLRPSKVTNAFGWRLVKLTFRSDAVAGSDWRVDDVLVDPRLRG
jgi:hypothetical protein